MADDKKNNLQDTFLNSVRKTKTSLTIFLVNGVKLQGVVTWFDNFCILLIREDKCKWSISTQYLQLCHQNLYHFLLMKKNKFYVPLFQT